VIGLQNLEAPPKWVKQTEPKTIFFISTKMGGVSVVVEPHFLSSTAFHPTNPDMEVYSKYAIANISMPLLIYTSCLEICTNVISHLNFIGTSK